MEFESPSTVFDSQSGELAQSKAHAQDCRGQSEHDAPKRSDGHAESVIHE